MKLIRFLTSNVIKIFLKINLIGERKKVATDIYGGGAPDGLDMVDVAKVEGIMQIRCVK